MRYLFILILSFSSFVNAGVKDAVADTKKINYDKQADLLIQNDNDALLILKKAAWDWFQANKSRLKVYDTAFEIPLAEVKNDGYLTTSAFLRKPGGLSGVNEMTAIWQLYTIKVMMTKNALNADEYRMILTTGLKSPPLPPPLIPNCYMFATYKNNGVTQVWDWQLMPDTAGIPLPVTNTNCADLGMPTMQAKAVNIQSNWASYGGPLPMPNITPTCSLVGVLPGGVSAPPNDYEDMVHCVFNYVPPATYCDGLLRFTSTSGSITNYGLTQKPNNCNSASQPIYTSQFMIESNAIITGLGRTSNGTSCILVSTNFIRCSATETPVAGTYCNGVLTVSLDAGGTSTFNLTQKSNDCNSASQAIYIANFITESNSAIATAGLSVNGLSCNVTNNHLDSCSATEDVAAAGLECKVYIYDNNGNLPPNSSPNFQWNDRDCTGFWSGSSGDSIWKHLEEVEHYNNIYLNANARINSNEYADYHLRDGALLGGEFSNDLYYNADVPVKRQLFIDNYNVANPAAQVENCTEFLGALSAIDAKHKVVCDAVPVESPITLIDVVADSSWNFIPTSSQSRTSGAININVLPIFGAGANGGKVERFRTYGGDMSPLGTVSFYKEWIRVDAGHTFSEVSNSGFIYKLDFSLSSSSTTNNLIINCPQGSSNVDVISGGTDIYVSASWPTTLERKSGFCSYVGNITEYKNTTPTGKSSSVSLSVHFVYETR